MWAVWLEVQRTQWRVGMGGATGIGFADLSAWLREVHALQGDDLARHLRGLDACQRGTLDAWAEIRDREETRREAERLSQHMRERIGPRHRRGA